jgi:hypothetical protein
MSEMIERVAMAIFVAADDSHNTWPTPEHPECVKMARVAIAAMREVPQDTFLAAEKAGISFATQNRVWSTMIDEMLK